MLPFEPPAGQGESIASGHHLLYPPHQSLAGVGVGGRKKQPSTNSRAVTGIGEDSRQPSLVVPEAATAAAAAAATQSLMERGEMKMEPKIEREL